MSTWPRLTDAQRDAAARLGGTDDYEAGHGSGPGEQEYERMESLVRRVMSEELVELRREREELAKVQRQLQVVFRPVQLGDVGGAHATPDGQDVVLMVNRATWASAAEALHSIGAIRERLERSEASCISTVSAVASMQNQLSAVNARLDNLYTLLVSSHTGMISPAVATRPLAPAAARTAPPSALATPAPSTPSADAETSLSRRHRRDEEDELLDDEETGGARCVSVMGVGEEEVAEPPFKKQKQKRDINAQNAFKKYLRERMALALNDAWPAYPAEGEPWPGTHYPTLEQQEAWSKADPATRGAPPKPEPWLRIDWHKEQTDSAPIVKLVNHFAAHLHAQADQYGIPTDRRSIETLRAALKRGYKGIKANFISTTKPHAQRTRDMVNAHQRRKRRRDKRRERRRIALQERGVVGAFEEAQAMSEEESEVDPLDATKRHAVHVRLIRPAFRSKQLCDLLESLVAGDAGGSGGGGGKSDTENNRPKGLFEPKMYLEATHAFMPAKPLSSDVQRYQVAQSFARTFPTLVQDVSLNFDAFALSAGFKPDQWGDDVTELPIHRPESETLLELGGAETISAGPSSDTGMALSSESGVAHHEIGTNGATDKTYSSNFGASSNAHAHESASNGPRDDGSTSQQEQQQ